MKIKSLMFLIFFLSVGYSNVFAVNNRIKENFFMFRNPTIKRQQDSRDNNVFERCMYYGYRGGAQPTSWFSERLYTNRAAIKSSANEAAFNGHINDALHDHIVWMNSNQDLLPPRSDRFEGMYEKFFVPWNGNAIFCFLVDSLITYQGANKAEKAIEVVSKAIFSTDSAFVSWYGCDSIIHQVCEEIHYQWRSADSSYIFESCFPKYTNYDSTEAYRYFFGIMNSIASEAEERLPNTSLTAIE